MNVYTARSLLDVRAVVSWFRRMPLLEPQRPGKAEILATWVKPGRYFNGHYRLECATSSEKEVLVSAFLIDPRQGRKLVARFGEHCCGQGDRAGCPACRSYLAGPDLLLQVFPYDYRLSTLTACLNPQRVAEAIGRPDQLTSCQVAAYRPGMRCQIRYRGRDGRSLFGKVAVEKERPGHAFAVQHTIYGQLAAEPRRFRVAEPQGYAKELCLTLVAEVAGRSLWQRLHTGHSCGAAMRPVAEALADLHELDLPSFERVYGTEDELALVDRWVGLIAALYPEHSPSLSKLYTALATELPARGGPHATVHRDFYDKQVLLGEGPPVFLDMDTACSGDPELDLGNFCAHLRLRGLQWKRSREYRGLEKAFVAAYPRAIETSRLAWYRRASLLRLACNYALRPWWSHLAADLIVEGGDP